jgi:hypothetical protein
VLKREPALGTWTFSKPIELEPLARQIGRWQL